MSKITNDGLTRSGTGCFIAVPATVGVIGLISICLPVTTLATTGNDLEKLPKFRNWIAEMSFGDY